MRERRTQRAEELLLEEGAAGRAVATLCEEFKISERSGWRYLKWARERWEREAAELGPEERETRRKKVRRTLEYVQGRGFKYGDMKAVLGATKQLRDLDGLDVPKELRLSGAIGVVDASSLFAERSTEDLIAFLRTGRLPAAADDADETSPDADPVGD